MRIRVGSIVLAIALLASGVALSSPSAGAADSVSTVRVLAGSELKDMQPILSSARDATGVDVQLQFTGSLDGAERIAAGKAADAAWFASDKYVALAGASTKILESKSTMLSPVVLGVTTSAAQRLGWQNGNVSWKTVSAAAASGQFRYAMTSPSASNSGFSALVGVADALAGNQAVTSSTIDAAGLRGFLSGQALTAGSSGFLADSYVQHQGTGAPLDGIINYESVLMTLNASHKLAQPLTLIYPSDGIVTADYPLMLLNSAKRPAFDRVTKYLLRPDVQRRIQHLTSRRAANPSVPRDSRFPSALLVEAPFPAEVNVVQALLDDYQSQLRRPANTIYVLDTSGSMDGDRITRLKGALTGLTGLDQSFSGHFTRFEPREQISFIAFSDTVQAPATFTVDSTDANSPALTAVRNHVNGLTAGGGTAIYSALDAAYTLANTTRAQSPQSVTSIVLMTDGENNAGLDAPTFLSRVKHLPAASRGIPVYTVLFGEANPAALTQIADATGGKVFDARTAPLSQVFKDIRGYQ